jgi:branched-chain amino acid transport system substrate-binding protein
VVEAIRNAQAIHGEKPLTGKEIRDGFENLEISEERLAELGLKGFMPPVKLSCADHEGTQPIRLQEWDGSHWSFVSDWIMPMKDVVRPLIEASAAEYASQNGIEPRDCGG